MKKTILDKLKDACQTVVSGYEDDGMENMQERDHAFYKACKYALADSAIETKRYYYYVFQSDNYTGGGTQKSFYPFDWTAAEKFLVTQGHSFGSCVCMFFTEIDEETYNGFLPKIKTGTDEKVL